jgi:biotin operon repressor
MLLEAHIGRDRGITAKAIADALGCAERLVRELVTELRMDGAALCGKPDTGYFMAATAAELEETCAFLRSRAMRSLVLESRMRHVPLPDLLGQLRLPT